MRFALTLAVILVMLAGASGCTSGTGVKPAATTAPSSTPVVEGEPSADEPTQPMEPSGQSDLLPWEGGTFTWDNGVSVTTSVEVLEPIAEKKIEFCDGCLTLVRKDLNFALRYTITVPKGFQGTLDTSSCGGSLSVDSGNDDESFVLYGGDDNRDLSGDMRAGTTKYGVEQWGIKKAARDVTFVYSNSCGDLEGTGMSGTGMWGGPLPKATTPQPDSMFKTAKGTYFEVKVVLVRQHKDGYAALAQACLMRSVPGIGDYVPSTLAPWTVRAGRKTVKGDPDDARTTYDPDATLTPGDEFGGCNNGWIFFPTERAQVTSIEYANSLGERASWSTRV